MGCGVLVQDVCSSPGPSQFRQSTGKIAVRENDGQFPFWANLRRHLARDPALCDSDSHAEQPTSLRWPDPGEPTCVQSMLQNASSRFRGTTETVGWQSNPQVLSKSARSPGVSDTTRGRSASVLCWQHRFAPRCSLHARQIRNLQHSGRAPLGKAERLHTRHGQNVGVRGTGERRPWKLTLFFFFKKLTSNSGHDCASCVV